ncbi:MAG: adenosylcobinamide-phosphate synthase CbiB [Acidobacteriota bacterium]|nr:adenosylcobinamide-phosphate synthase CbiB [Acidobacteriota bacterium]
MSISTTRGDGGQTGLAGGIRVSKADLRVESYGSVDELNTFLGLARSNCQNLDIKARTETIQRTLFRLGSARATPPESKKQPPMISLSCWPILQTNLRVIPNGSHTLCASWVMASQGGEAVLRHVDQGNRVQFLSGAALTAAVVAGSYAGTRKLLREAQNRSVLLGDASDILLAWTCLAARNLQQEATFVIAALESGDLALSRTQLARIVGRDTDHLQSADISRAIIETVAESASDGVTAPLFYMALGGVPLAMAYKAVNTLDSMIGHAEERYFYFGKAAARLDDFATYLPARLTACAISVAAVFLEEADALAAWRAWHRDGAKHKSPNAGQPESAMAGALHVCLGGPNTYAGELISAPDMGADFPKALVSGARRSVRLVWLATLVILGFSTLVAASVQTSKLSRTNK